MAGMMTFAHKPDVWAALDMTNATVSFRPESAIGGRSGEIWLRTGNSHTQFISYESLFIIENTKATAIAVFISKNVESFPLCGFCIGDIRRRTGRA